MPELPEVETIVRGIREPLTGKTIMAAQVFSLKIRTMIPQHLSDSLTGVRIASVVRRAKYILIHLESGSTLIIHLGMTGNLRLLKPSLSPYQSGRHDHLWLQLNDKVGLVFSDPRRFGMLDIVKTDTLDEWAPFRKLGPEPLDSSFTGLILAERFKGKKVAVKLALMNQDVVVGVGNIYASEALFAAGISPLRAAGQIGKERVEKLCAAVKKVLRAAIRAGGSSLRDYRNADGNVGFFQNKFNVYNREGEACPGCMCDIAQTGGIKKIAQGGRSTFYCPRKQT